MINAQTLKEDEMRQLMKLSEKEILIAILLELRRNTNFVKGVEMELFVIKQLLKR